MTNVSFNNQITSLIQQINALHASEIKYHLLLLLNTLKHNQNTTTENILTQLGEVIDGYQQCFNQPSPESITQLLQKYQALVDVSNVNALSVKIGYAILFIGAILFTVVLSVLGGVIGIFAGLARSILEGRNPLKQMGIGFVIGVWLGAIIGYRTPDLLKNKLTLQLSYCLDAMYECINNLNDENANHILSFKQDVLSNYFNNDQKSLDNFLNVESVSYDICSIHATFIDPSLAGFLGHHTLIKLKILDQETTIEFTTSTSDLSNGLSQQETRQVSGQKIVDMLMLHKMLQKRHEATTEYIFTKMKPGIKDCMSYVNMILTGTDQAMSTNVKRFDGSENWIGRHLIHGFFQKVSPFSDGLHETGAATREPVVLNIR